MTDTIEPKIDTRLWTNKAKNLTPYVPGEQPKQDELCKLNTNENPYPPSPKVKQAIDAVLANQAQQLRLYPAPESDELREALADYYGLASEQVFVGNGSDEVLAFTFGCFLAKERPLLTPDIGYSFYPIYADTFDIDVIKIPLRNDFTIAPDDYRQPCSGIIIANPNAPTGVLLSLEAIEKLAGEHPNAIIVVDEAYIDFVQPVIKASTESAPDAEPVTQNSLSRLSNEQQSNVASVNEVSAISLIKDYDNVLVIQTFSKSRSLAGLRVGMAFGNASLIEALTRMKNSFNSYPLDRLAQAGAIASIKDIDYFKQTCQKVIELRERLKQGLTTLGFTVLPSQANFIFARPPKGEASELAAQLRERGIIVRYFDKQRLNDYLRVTIGTAEQNQRLLDALREIESLIE